MNLDIKASLNTAWKVVHGPAPLHTTALEFMFYLLKLLTYEPLPVNLHTLATVELCLLCLSGRFTVLSRPRSNVTTLPAIASA